MAATITSSGTWSTIATAERPTPQGGTTDERYNYESLIYETDLASNVGAFPELEQFIALMGAAYTIDGRSAAVRLSTMLNVYLNRANRVSPERSYTP
jgi:hypothetical protein